MSGTSVQDTDGSAGHHMALLELAVRAAGAHGGQLRLPGDGIVARTGALDGPRSEIELRDPYGKGVGWLALARPEKTDGLGRLLSDLFAAIPQDEAEAAAAFERELHHRSGNLLQTVASMLQMQVDSFETLGEVGPDQGRALVTEARTRVLVVGAVQMTMEAASCPDRRIATHRSLPELCDRLIDILPGEITFTTDFTELHTRRTHASALGVMIAEFAIAATRDAFPKPDRHHFDVLTTAYTEDGLEHVSMELRHQALGYDTREWRQGAPALAARMVEAVATQLDGLVAIDRDGDDGRDGDLRLRLVFDRPSMTEAEPSTHGSNEGSPFGKAPNFDTRLGVHAGSATTMRKP